MEDVAIRRVAVEMMDVVEPEGAAAAGMTSCWRVWRGRLTKGDWERRNNFGRLSA